MKRIVILTGLILASLSLSRAQNQPPSEKSAEKQGMTVISSGTARENVKAKKAEKKPVSKTKSPINRPGMEQRAGPAGMNADEKAEIAAVKADKTKSGAEKKAMIIAIRNKYKKEEAQAVGKTEAGQPAKRTGIRSKKMDTKPEIK